MQIEYIKSLISKKMNHNINTKLQKIEAEIDKLDVSFDEKNAKKSRIMTDLSFETTEFVIKKIISKINPKSVNVNLELNRQKYIKSIHDELARNLPDDLSISSKSVSDDDLKQKSSIHIEYLGYPMKDGGFIGEKIVKNPDELLNIWKNDILTCISCSPNSSLVDDELEEIKEYINYGFIKALDSKYVIIDKNQFETNLDISDKLTLNGTEIKCDNLRTFLDAKSV